ncbi:MAG: Txe/YoeB family addiction module toxin [Paludibacter sp.]|jgi:toxin YoeB|nr:Txe/YoeB family addiction module toxin [Paludibacter sp.]
MEFLFKDTAENDLIYFGRNKPILKRIENLLKDIKQHPFTGIGKPEMLKENLSGYWSRRIDKEHRILYTVENDSVTFYSFRGHY